MKPPNHAAPERAGAPPRRARVRTAAFALACGRCKEGVCGPGADRVLAPALRHLADDPDPQVRSRAVELAGKSVHTEPRALAALRAARADDPSPAVRPFGRRRAGTCRAGSSTGGRPRVRLSRTGGRRVAGA
ncbi:HEAT repeat domain-containing protein [Kitasatospora phosalacinea]|uniref:HEAT repeat domain-containing protein n=1 Tax=Kitasatospora phosalacinea TaxID=2065 RepID=A0A9W6PBN6_9ACTN|nr:HEAT repeat domain-containing protein [Kitasatospora phosalacinea]GLW52161.1 hypothetical protein Kpho01_01720 [Kitasatospora phosalacinea]